MEQRTTRDLLMRKRLCCGLSANALALRSGLSHSYVAKYEAGEIDQISLQAFARIATALGLTPKEIALIIATEAQ